MTTRGIVLLVHGGREVGTDAVGRFDPPVLRMELFHRSLRRPLARLGVEAHRFRFSQRGWNGDGSSALADLGGAIDELAVHGPGRVVLVGHSMGARASMRFADHPAVAGVVGLAPWLPPGEILVDVEGRELRVAHGTEDRTTAPRTSLEFVERARVAGANAHHVLVPGEGHALLRRPRWWNRFILQSARGMLDPPGDR